MRGGAVESVVSGFLNAVHPEEIYYLEKNDLYFFFAEHQQIEGARRIAPEIDIHNNTSTSFRFYKRHKAIDRDIIGIKESLATNEK